MGEEGLLGCVLDLREELGRARGWMGWMGWMGALLLCCYCCCGGGAMGLLSAVQCSAVQHRAMQYFRFLVWTEKILVVVSQGLVSEGWTAD